MTLEDAIALIEPGVSGASGTWADIGAGTGMFTRALADILGRGEIRPFDKLRVRVYAVDKSPHALWAVKAGSETEIEIVEADFHHALDLPPLDGIVMANALHYAKDHELVLNNVLKPLKSGGTFILVEYDTETPKPPWVPNPVSLQLYKLLCLKVGLSVPTVIGNAVSRYGYERIYAAVGRKG